ncbi:glycosyltransferase 87 family protein [Streptomyces sp. KM273126]|uniref:glycosyltransferase 87 family protein n=1 Tax=Streptomyces sp. KM273126 TaxID=2545247 RepID=UPI00215D9591|nr:glycosyltransferase 87 family protein [Streptomyces sp. KM273126]
MGRASWQAWAALGAVLCALVVSVAQVSAAGGMDNAIVVRAARAFWNGGSPYADQRFFYFPSAMVAAAPQVLVPPAVLRVLVPAVTTGLLVAGWACALRLHGVPWRSRFAVLGLVGLAVGFAPFGHLVRLGNWTATAAAALPLALLLMSRGRWGTAGAVLGAAVALKPLLAPMVLLFVFARRWRGLGLMVLVPVVASGGSALLMQDPAEFFTRTLPSLLSGHEDFVRLYEASLGAVLPRLGVPQPVASAVAVGAAGVGLWCAYGRWRRGGGGPLRLTETACLLMLSVFLVSRPSFDHYLVVVLPLLLASAALPGSVARSPWFWLALVPQVPGFTWPYLELPTRRAFKDAVTLCALALTLAWHRPPAEELAPAAPAHSPPESPPRSHPQGLRPFDPAQGAAPPGPSGSGAAPLDPRV